MLSLIEGRSCQSTELRVAGQIFGGELSLARCSRRVNRGHRFGKGGGQGVDEALLREGSGRLFVYFQIDASLMRKELTQFNLPLPWL
jgi:hypothetical protein